MKRINHRHYVSVAILFSLILWSVFVCRNSYIRLFYSVIDFFVGLVYAVFFNSSWCPEPRVNELIGVNVSSYFPTSWITLKEDFNLIIELLFSKDNFLNYLIYINPKITFVTQLLMLLVLGIALFMLIKLFIKPAQNNDYGAETKACRMFKRICAKVFTPSWDYLKSLYSFFRERRYYFIPAVIIFLCSTNLATILVAFMAYYFYLCGSTEFSSLIYQLYKLSADIIILLGTLPLPVWLCIGVAVFNKITIYFAYARLDRQEHKNSLFLDNLGIVVFIIGVMRAGKTALLTSLLISQAIKFRRMSKKIMLKVHSHFPYFPYAVYQQELQALIKAKKIKSLAGMERYVAKRKKRFLENPCPENLYGYDYERYGYRYDDGLVISDIWDELLKFGHAYLVFTEPTYFVCNYAVRENHRLVSVGNMPDWDMEIFRRESFDGDGEYAHILDHDMLRPGKKMNPGKNVYGTLEYAIIGEAEIDKERANTLELQETKAKEDECNQKNDLYNQHLKMMGHGGMIDFMCFVRMFCDSQRASSWGADGRELSDVISIDAVSEDRLALRFFHWRALLRDIFQGIHDSGTFSHWFNRGDTSLPVYLLWKLTCKYLNYCERIQNTFGYRVQRISRQAGTEEGPKTEYKYYDQNKKVRAGMYATDSHVSYFRKNNLRANLSLDEVERYSTLHPTYEEMAEKSNSHMYKKWTEQNQSSDKSPRRASARNRKSKK